MPFKAISRRRLRYLLRPTTERVVVAIALILVVTGVFAMATPG